MSVITVIVNGQSRVLDVGTSVAEVVALVAPSPKGIAVAINADVVPRSFWSDTTVVDGDSIELLTAAQGG